MKILNSPQTSADVFNRFEQKYIISAQAAADLQAYLLTEQFLQYDKHCADGQPYPIHNLYYDTADRALIRRSLDKPIYKQKLRLRSYTNFDDPTDIIWLEVKKKFEGRINKRRTKMTLLDAKQFIELGSVPAAQEYHNKQVVRELKHFVMGGIFCETATITYQRLALISPTTDLRISFDNDIIATQGQAKTRLLPADQCVLEVKVPLAMPLWLSAYLTEHQIKRSSFSKYGKFHNMSLNKLKETA